MIQFEMLYLLYIFSFFATITSLYSKTNKVKQEDSKNCIATYIEKQSTMLKRILNFCGNRRSLINTLRKIRDSFNMVCTVQYFKN